MRFRIEPYHRTHQPAWDAFIRSSRDGTFLFYRDYMEYHSDRFLDASLLVFDEHGQLLALLPANLDGDHLVSHGGLTYGGFVTGEAMRVAMGIEMFGQVLGYLAEQGISRMTYKAIPYIYHRRPAGEMWFALGTFRATLARRDVLSVITPSEGFVMQERRRRSIRKAMAAGLGVQLTESYAEFWELLEENLVAVYGVKPVHTLDEILLLHGRFPDNIKLFVAMDGLRIIAGVVIYENVTVAHVQYVGTTERGRKLGAVDLIYHWLLTEYYAAKPYFDLGNSLGADRWNLNLGVLEFKESLGGRAIVQDFFELDVRRGSGAL